MVRVLDLGCGAGACTRFLADEGFAVTAIDCSNEALTRMRYNLQRWDLPKVDAICHDLASPLPLASETFDVALDNLTMTHIEPETRLAICKELHRVLVPHGTFITRRFGPDCREIEDRGFVDYRASSMSAELRILSGSSTPPGHVWEETSSGIHIVGMAIQKCA